jgi:hypothetical protein
MLDIYLAYEGHTNHYAKWEELLVQFVYIKFGTSNEESINLHISAQWSSIATQMLVGISCISFELQVKEPL